MDRKPVGRDRPATRGQDGTPSDPGVRNGGKLDRRRLDDVAGGTLPAVNDPYSENF